MRNWSPLGYGAQQQTDIFRKPELYQEYDWNKTPSGKPEGAARRTGRSSRTLPGRPVIVAINARFLKVPKIEYLLLCHICRLCYTDNSDRDEPFAINNRRLRGNKMKNVNKNTCEFLRKFMESFAVWLRTNTGFIS